MATDGEQTVNNRRLEAFLLYQSLPPDKRTIRRVSEEIGVPFDTLKRYSVQDNWKDKVLDYDIKVAQKAIERARKAKEIEIAKRIKQSYQARTLTNKHALKLLKRVNVESVDSGDYKGLNQLVQAIREANNLIEQNELASYDKHTFQTSQPTVSNNGDDSILPPLEVEGGLIQQPSIEAETVLATPSPDLCSDSQPADTDDPGTSG